MAAGQSFEQIERAIAEALPNLKTPLVPRNVPWFTVRAQDFPNPEIAREILDAYGEDRGEGRRLYRFPVVFPSGKRDRKMTEAGGRKIERCLRAITSNAGGLPGDPMACRSELFRSDRRGLLDRSPSL